MKDLRIGKRVGGVTYLLLGVLFGYLWLGFNISSKATTLMDLVVTSPMGALAAGSLYKAYRGIMGKEYTKEEEADILLSKAHKAFNRTDFLESIKLFEEANKVEELTDTNRRFLELAEKKAVKRCSLQEITKEK